MIKTQLIKTLVCLNNVALPSSLGIHDNLETPLNDEEDIETSPDGEGYVEIAVVRVQINISKSK